MLKLINTLKKLEGVGMELYGEQVGFSSNLYNSARVKIKWHYGTLELGGGH